MRQSESFFLDLRDLRYHVRRWPHPGAPKPVLLHGWMDVSASFQFLVDELRRDWDVHAPDWRGYGLTEWASTDCYWFPDYIAIGAARTRTEAWCCAATRRTRS